MTRTQTRRQHSDKAAASLRVLILSSSMGAGHDGSAKELIRRLEEAGHEARMHDYLDALPLRIGHMIRWNYRLQLRFAPWSYENSYHFMPRIYGLLVFLNAHLARRRLEKWMTEFPPDVIVSNNPLATLAIGRLRERHKLSMPTVTYITDFGVHPLWIHPGIDLHLAVHPEAAADASRRSGGGRASAPGPMVGSAFRDERPSRAASRSAFGLVDGDRAVLVVAGSWGVGDVEETARLLVSSGRFVPVTVCGKDERLRRRLEADGLGIVIGWTDQMPSLMAAADAMVENAGGLTSMEALAAGLPVVTYHAIPGHGQDNAAAMASAGVTRWPTTSDELLDVLDQVTSPGMAREELVSSGAGIFAGDAAVDVASVAEPGAAAVTLRAARRRRVGRRTLGAVAATAAVYGTMTAGVAAAASYGLTVPSNAHPARAVLTPAGYVRPVAYLGVRLTAAELADPTVVKQVEALGATVIITSSEALQEPATVRQIAATGADIATGGCGRAPGDVLTEHVDVASAGAIVRATGVHPSAYVPSRPVDALDLLWASERHLTIVVAQHTFGLGNRVPTTLHAGQRYVVDGRETSPAQLSVLLGDVSRSAQSNGMVVTGLEAFEH